MFFCIILQIFPQMIGKRIFFIYFIFKNVCDLNFILRRSWENKIKVGMFFSV